MPEKIGSGYITVEIDRSKFDNQLRNLESESTIPISKNISTAVSVGIGTGLSTGLTTFRPVKSRMKEYLPDFSKITLKTVKDLNIKGQNIGGKIAAKFGDGAVKGIVRGGNLVDSFFTKIFDNKKISNMISNISLSLKKGVTYFRQSFIALSKSFRDLGALPGFRRLGRLMSIFTHNIYLTIAAIGILGGIIGYKLVRPFKAVAEPLKIIKNDLKLMASLAGQILLSALPISQGFKSWADFTDKLVLGMRKYADSITRVISVLGLMWSTQFSLMDFYSFRFKKGFERIKFFVDKIFSKNPFSEWAEETEKIKKNVQFFGLEEAFRMAQINLNDIKDKLTMPKEKVDEIKEEGFLSKITSVLRNVKNSIGDIVGQNIFPGLYGEYNNLITRGLEGLPPRSQFATVTGTSLNNYKTLSLLEQIAKNTQYGATKQTYYNVFSGAIR